jgi:hypothetical protein
MREGYRDRVRSGLPAGDERHGTANGYLNYGCRCEACKGAGAVYNSAVARRQRHFATAGSPCGSDQAQTQSAPAARAG